MGVPLDAGELAHLEHLRAERDRLHAERARNCQTMNELAARNRVIDREAKRHQDEITRLVLGTPTAAKGV